MSGVRRIGRAGRTLGCGAHEWRLGCHPPLVGDPGIQEPVRLTQPITHLQMHRTTPSTQPEYPARTRSAAAPLINRMLQQQGIQRTAEPAPRRAEPLLSAKTSVQALTQNPAQHRAQERVTPRVHPGITADHQRHTATVRQAADSTARGRDGAAVPGPGSTIQRPGPLAVTAAGNVTTSGTVTHNQALIMAAPVIGRQPWAVELTIVILTSPGKPSSGCMQSGATPRLPEDQLPSPRLPRFIRISLRPLLCIGSISLGV